MVLLLRSMMDSQLPSIWLAQAGGTPSTESNPFGLTGLQNLGLVSSVLIILLSFGFYVLRGLQKDLKEARAEIARLNQVMIETAMPAIIDATNTILDIRQERRQPPPRARRT